MEIIKQNFVEVFSNWKYLVLSIISMLLIGSIFIYFTNLDMIFGNFGGMYMWAQIILQLLITLLFGIFLPISVYKYITFSSFSIKETSSSSIGSFLGIIVAGCPACSITLASYLGLVSIISLLPWYGLELKLIAVPLMLYSNYSILKNLKTCKIKNGN